MSFFLENWTLFAVAIASGAMLLWPMAKGGAVGGGLTPSDAVQLMNREKALVIDVCSADEFAAGHVKGARHVPLDELASRLPTVAKNKAVPLAARGGGGPQAGLRKGPFPEWRHGRLALGQPAGRKSLMMVP